MAFDGIITRGMVTELRSKLLQGKVDKINQPLKDELVIGIHGKSGNYKLFASCASSGPRVHLIQDNPYNPPTPFNFCMLLRKHLGGGRISDIRQYKSERIIEIYFDTVNELGFSLSKKLVFEIMGKHSNIILVDVESGNVLDSIKHISIDTSRARQVLPGIKYSYPPAQDKIGFLECDADIYASLPRDSKAILNRIGGISPQLAQELALVTTPMAFMNNLIEETATGDYIPHIYSSGDGPVDYHIAHLSQYEDVCVRIDYPDLSSCIDAFFLDRAHTGRLRQSAGDMHKNLSSLLEKARLKKKRLLEDLMEAEDSEYLRLYGELLTANLHIKPESPDYIVLENYYDGDRVRIPLDPRFSLSKNAQSYYKRYGKSKTAVKEKSLQLEETERDIEYLESTLANLERIEKPEDLEAIRQELYENGYIKKSSIKSSKGGNSAKGGKSANKKYRPSPYTFTSPSGFKISVGRNNKENDELTMHMAAKTDIWLHTKDIHGSHVIMETNGKHPEAEDIYYAAAIAAYYSKARESSNVPVDYVPVRYVKKPAGAKPGMVIFTNNKTVYVDPAKPE